MSTIILDDFSTGMPFTRLGTGSQTSFLQNLGAGIARRTTLSVTTDPYSQFGSVSINNGLLVVSAGYKTMDGLELFYGQSVDERNGNNYITSFHLDFTKFKEIVISFHGCTQNLNINLVVYSHSGRTTWSENRKFIGCGVDKQGECFTRVGQENPQELIIPITFFTEQPPTHPSYDPKDITNIHIGIQNLGHQGGHSYAIDKIVLR